MHSSGIKPPLLETPRPSARILSLDAFRGANMLCILGLDCLAHSLAAVFPQLVFFAEVSRQFSHKQWMGLTLYDCIFPTFVFISGVSMAFSFEKKRENGEEKRTIVRSLLFRALILVSLGAILQNALSFNISETRFASVLGLIGIANALGGLIALFLKTPWKILLALTFIVGILTCLQFLCGDFTPEGTINSTLDRLFLPGKLHNGNYDPEGILCVISACVPVISGYLVGIFLCQQNKRNGNASWKTAITLASLGFALVGFSQIAGTIYPIIKNIWTQTFALSATGWSLIAFSIFYVLFDLLKIKKIAFFFKVIGVNALAIYILQWIFPFDNLSELLFEGVAGFFNDASAVSVLILGAILLKWLLLYWLNQRKIYFKI